MIEVDAATLAVSHVAVAAVGAFAYRLWLDRRRREDSICPTCFGPLDDDGSSEAWGARLEPAEGTVLQHPDDDSRGFLVLDGGRVGEVDVVPAEAMLIAEDVGRFHPRDDVDGGPGR